MNTAKVRKLVFAAFFAAVIFLGTFVIKIPIPNGIFILETDLFMWQQLCSQFHTPWRRRRSADFWPT